MSADRDQRFTHDDDTADAGGHPLSRVRRLRWLAIAGVITFVGLLEGIAWLYFPSFGSWPGRLILAVLVVAAMVAICNWLFREVARAEEALERGNRELLSLHRSSLDIYGELSLDLILQKVVDQTRELLNAKYGAVSVISEDETIEQFVTSGVSDVQRRAIGDPPAGRGVLGVPLHRGESLRLGDLTSHPQAAGFPPNHPAMRSLLAMPIVCKCSFRGNLYLADKLDGGEFTADDEVTLRRFADQVAIAIDNADTHRQLASLVIAEERGRLAREMHDGMAQILAYANTKAQVVREHLRNERPVEAAIHLEQLASAAREAYRDAREGILALRTTPENDESLSALLQRYVDQWQAQSRLTVEIDADNGIELDGSRELQLLRIVQEALSNARKHSEADRATVTLRRGDGYVSAAVADNGRGFDHPPHDRTGTPRFGLKIMRERAESVGGTLSIDSTPGEGTEVTVTIPTSD